MVAHTASLSMPLVDDVLTASPTTGLRLRGGGTIVWQHAPSWQCLCGRLRFLCDVSRWIASESDSLSSIIRLVVFLATRPSPLVGLCGYFLLVAWEL
eukprot:4182294-Prymnesium_polylepis.1